MSSVKEEVFSGLGVVRFTRRVQAKRYIIRLGQGDERIEVTVPRYGSFKQARVFVEERRVWLEKHLAKLRAERADCEPRKELSVKEKAGMKRYLLKRLAFLASRHGYRYNRVFIREQRTRWGSCSSAHNINLNVALARLPEALCDYVILHELAHTRVPNHGARFWAELGKTVGNARELDRELRRYSPRG